MLNSKWGIVIRNYLSVKVDNFYTKRADSLIREVINHGVYIAEDEFTVLVDLNGRILDIWIANRFYSYLSLVTEFPKKDACFRYYGDKKRGRPLKSIEIYDGERPSRKTCIDFTEWLFSQKCRVRASFKGCVAGAYALTGKDWRNFLYIWKEKGIPKSIPAGWRGFI